MDLVAKAVDGEEAIKSWREHRPDVTLVDLFMPGKDGIEVIRAIRSEDPSARVLILTTYDGEENIYRGINAGARGYLLKDARPSELLDAIRKVHGGERVLPAVVAGKLADRLAANPLTPRELQVLELLAVGRSNRDIALALGTSEHTVKTHLRSIFEKLDAISRLEAVNIAFQRGIVRR